MKILDRVFCVFPLTWGRSTPNIDPTIKISQIEASNITFFLKIPRSFGKNL